MALVAAVTHSGSQLSWAQHRGLRNAAFVWGVSAGVALVAVYLGVLALANSADHAVTEFQRLWHWMTPLILGFAVQVGLFAYARAATRGGHAAHARGVVASGGASTVSMVACCAHHLTDVLPLVGLAGAALFLTRYQTLFLLLGVLSNVVGLVYMLGLLRRHGLVPARRGLLALSVRWPVERALLPVAVASAVIFIAAVVTSI
jgi:uncharacterized integral membrane protein